MNDDWAPDLRLASCILMEKILEYLKDLLTDFELKDIYPILLERLDDPQDAIRIEITKSLSSFLKSKQLRMSPSIFEYLIKAIIVHLDDQNEQIQLAIFSLLKIASEMDPKLVLDEGRKSVAKQKYPRKCQELIRYIEESMEHLLEIEKNKRDAKELMDQEPTTKNDPMEEEKVSKSS